jgi:hypothetical protein
LGWESEERVFWAKGVWEKWVEQSEEEEKQQQQQQQQPQSYV